MDTRIFHGKITPDDFARSLIAHFNRGNYRVQQVGDEDHLAVQIATRDGQISGGQTATSIDIQTVEDGVSIQVGQQAWFGIAASLGMTAFSAIRNPWTLLGRLDDLAQDFESLSLTTEIWKVIEAAAAAANAGTQLSERLRRLVCPYCTTANEVGQDRCIACGAPLGKEQPITCVKCGFVVNADELFCPNCGSRLV